MSENNYPAMANMFREAFDSRKVAVFPVDHGGAVQAIRLKPYLHEAGINFVLYEREGATRPEENCIDQGNLYLFDEVRQIVTPRRRVKRFLRREGDVDEIVLLDDWATSVEMPSLGGGWVYFVMLGYPNAKTAAFRDRCGGADISPDRESSRRYNGTRDYIRQNNPHTYYHLLGNGLLPCEDEDSFFTWMLEKSSLVERVKLYALRRADQILITPLARRRKKIHFVKDATDRILSSSLTL